MRKFFTGDDPHDLAPGREEKRSLREMMQGDARWSYWLPLIALSVAAGGALVALIYWVL